MDNAVKKLYLGTIGFTSILLVVANTFLFVGATAGSRAGVGIAVYLILGMCLFLLLVAIGTPVCSLLVDSNAVITKISTGFMVVTAFVMTVFIELWLYFMLVAQTYLNEL